MPARKQRTMSYHQALEARNKQAFKAQYSACSGDSTYHDLRCGHRVQSANLSERCGCTCRKPARGAPFVCPECVVNDVCLEMNLEGISLSNSDDAEMDDGGPTREQKIRAIADAEIKKRLTRGFRMCKVTSKFEDPKLQFFHQFYREEGFDGIDEDGHKPVAPNKLFKRPGLSMSRTNRMLKKDVSNVWRPREPKKTAEHEDFDDDAAMIFTFEDMERDWKDLQAHIPTQPAPMHAGNVVDLAEEMGHSHTGLELEDDATKAVRQALEECTLGAATAGGD